MASVLNYCRRSFDRHPWIVMSTAMGVVGFAFAALGPPIRRGLTGNQMRSYYGASYAPNYTPRDAAALRLKALPPSSSSSA
jgi:hypothetical protein|tara:strand:+ start:198 stop:440 length:243 start_codon:yes stop_codon:yes gene_type:complete